jgi:transposase
MSFLPGAQRSQVQLLPPAIDELIGPDNPVRFLDAFVDKIDLRAAGFVFPKENAHGSGRPAYHPADLLKLFLYGYLHQLRSSRRLETECHRNLEVIWLLRQLAPDFKTIADFRKNNAGAFKAVVREFTRLCRQLDLFGGQFLAIDGSRFKASNDPNANWSQPRLEKQLARLDARAQEYLQALAQADEQGPAGPANSASELQEKIARLQGLKTQLQKRLGAVQQSGQTQISATDPDSRCMKGPQGAMIVGYNVQASVDDKHHLLVTTEATNTAADQGQLARVAAAAKTELDIKNADVVADTGYYKANDIKACQDMGLEAHVPSPQNSSSKRAGLFGKTDFQYDAARDLYRCPAGGELHRRGQTIDKSRLVHTYANTRACAVCPQKSRCTRARDRVIYRWEHEERLERMEKIMRQEPQKLARRQALIEHCWAALKRTLAGGFIVRGLERVNAEVSLAHFAYNFRRALKVVGSARLTAALA